MQIFYKTRKELRNSKISGKNVDNGTYSEVGKRWAKQVQMKPASQRTKK